MLKCDKERIEKERGNGFLKKTRMVNATNKGKNKSRKKCGKKYKRMRDPKRILTAYACVKVISLD